MEQSGGIQASLSGRYASALFALAREQGSIDSVEKSIVGLQAALDQLAEFRALTTSPLLGRQQALKTVDAVAGSMGLDSLTRKFLGVLAGNRRLADLPGMIRAFRQMAADARGEVRAEVTSAHPLAADQLDALKHNLKSRYNRDVVVETTVDPSILGGLVVKVGSQMIDGSIRTKLNTLAQAMKG